MDKWLSYRYDTQSRASIEKYCAMGHDIGKSVTINAIQINWSVPSEFPCCPKGIVEDPITSYFDNLEKGSLFCKNDRYQRFVLDTVMSQDERSIVVLSEASDIKIAIKPWTLAKIEYANSKYVHYNLGSFFTNTGALKCFCLEQGKEWTGDDSIDDYC